MKAQEDFAIEAFRHAADSLANGLYTDLTLRCKSFTVDVHQLVISRHSGVFRALYANRDMEGPTKPVCLDDDEPMVVARCILFMYTGSYLIHGNHLIHLSLADKLGLQTCDYKLDRFKTDAKMYAAGERYQIPALQEVAKKAYKRGLRALKTTEQPNETEPSATGSALKTESELATNRRNPAQPRSVDESIVRDYLDSVEIIYATVASGDRTLLDIAIQHAMKRPQLVQSETLFCKLAVKHPDFAFALLKVPEANSVNGS